MTVRDIQVDYSSISTGGAALAHQAQHVNGCSDDAEQSQVSPDEELALAPRTLDQERAYRALKGEGGFSSWERVLASAVPENRLDIIRRALGELFPLAERASVSHLEDLGLCDAVWRNLCPKRG